MKFCLSIIFSLFISCNCFAAPAKELKKSKLALENGMIIEVFLAISEQHQQEGLSGWKSLDLKKEQGMLFLYKEVGIRNFWMPDTYFNLDIIYLDSNFTVLKIDRNAPAHPGRTGNIPKLKPTFSHHVLEIHADSNLSKIIKVGTKLAWMGSHSVKEILQDTHR